MTKKTECNFQDLSEDIVDFFNERYENFVNPVSLGFYFQENNKQKQLIKLTKIPEQYGVIIKKDILVQVNSEYFDAFSTDGNEINEILFDKTIDMIHCNMDKGTFTIQSKPDFSANEGIIDKYSYDSVKRALEMERLYEEQKNDSE
jgi:hypothetical protein